MFSPILSKYINKYIDKYNDTDVGKNVLPMFIIPIFLIYTKKEIYDVYSFISNFFSNPNIISIIYKVHKKEITTIDNKKNSSVRIKKKTSSRYNAICYYINQHFEKIIGGKKYCEQLFDEAYVTSLAEGETIIIDADKQIYCKFEEFSSINIFIKYSFNKNNEKNEKNKKICYQILEKFLLECEIEYLEHKKNSFIGKQVLIKYNIEENHIIKDFVCSKSIEKNLYIEKKDELIKYIDQFNSESDNIESNQKYDKMGYTHKAIIMLHGPPGTGKTSTIKTILKRTKRHGVLVNFGQFKTCADFEHIFMNTIYNNVNIPLKKLCFIFEDIDGYLNSNILFKREFRENDENNKLEGDDLIKYLASSINSNKKKEEFGEQDLCFSFILNLFDGVQELKDIMIIFTTNHINKFDEALLRPGRIDFTLELEYPNKNMIIDVVMNCYDIDDINIINEIDLIKEIRDKLISVAEIQSICFTTLLIEEAIKKIIFSQNNNN
jgi:ATP-dependent Zn protease